MTQMAGDLRVLLDELLIVVASHLDPSSRVMLHFTSSFFSQLIQDIPEKRDPCQLAALEGHLSIVEWARSNDCPWGDTTIKAAEGGHLEVLSSAPVEHR